jgi:hypothetical protein
VLLERALTLRLVADFLLGVGPASFVFEAGHVL